MKCYINYERLQPDTLRGEALVIKYYYTSFDTAEMDKFEADVKKDIKDGIILDYGEEQNEIH